MRSPFKEVYQGKTVLVTGHTGFKGSWLSIWLRELGANVIGYSLDPPTDPNHFALTMLQDKMISITGDIRDASLIKKTLHAYSPDIIFHLAAQAIVLHSYARPRETFEVNAMGTVNVLEAARENSHVKAMVMVTTDKCYENHEWMWGYRENDRLGGGDPYSASKAMAELAIHAYRESYPEGPLAASARAGNVIGGGDFSEYRLIPDVMKALLENKPVKIRNPSSVRPWLHVLDPLCGYLQLGAKLLENDTSYAQAWNFGPMEIQGVPVQGVVEKALETWGKGSWEPDDMPSPKKEMSCLRLNWDKASHLLSWKPRYSWQAAINKTVEWFKAYEASLLPGVPKDMYACCVKQINEYHKLSAQSKAIL